LEGDPGVLELTGLRKAFGAAQIIRGVSLAVRRGERHAIIGPNGAGKSTLLNLVSGRLRASAGSVRLDGREISRLPPHEICRAGVSRSFQVTNVFHRMSVIENLRCAAMHAARYRCVWWRPMAGMREVAARAEEVLAQLVLAAHRDKLAGELAYAEQRALEIGLAISNEPAVLLLDEPTAGMSREESLRAVELIRAVTVPPRSLIVIEHDMSVVFSLADRISVLVYGEIIASDTPAAIQANVAVQEAYLGTHALRS
jgi:branched-chain amino acid transport system ATP-binding protein